MKLELDCGTCHRTWIEKDMGEVCPWCEIERLTAKLAEATGPCVLISQTVYETMLQRIKAAAEQKEEK